jgi:trigger factor
MARVETSVEELPENRVRLTVGVPREDVKHAVDHAAHDLAESARIPGFRKGKVPMPVLMAKLGRERVYSEAVESHIGGWFWNAAAETRIRPVEQPAYDYQLPASDKEGWSFTATVEVQPTPPAPDWKSLEVPIIEAEVPEQAIEAELDALRSSVAELVPVEERPAQPGDTLVIDVVEPGGNVQRDLVVELGSGRLLEEIESGLVGTRAGDTRAIEVELADDSRQSIEVTVKELKEKVLAPADDELARAATEFDTLEELRADIEQRIRAQLDLEIESAFRTAVADALVDAAKVDARGPLVEARARELERGLVRSLAGRGVSADAYLQLTGQSIGEVQQRLRTEAERSVARELVLEAIADELDIQVSDDELREFLREEAAPGEDADALIEQVFQAGRQETLRDDLRLRRALDRAASEVKRIPADLAAARDKLWTPEKERPKTETKLWTPGSKEP